MPPKLGGAPRMPGGAPRALVMLLSASLGGDRCAVRRTGLAEDSGFCMHSTCSCCAFCLLPPAGGRCAVGQGGLRPTRSGGPDLARDRGRPPPAQARRRRGRRRINRASSAGPVVPFRVARGRGRTCGAWLVNERIRAINEYVYAKYVEVLRVESVDERAALEELQAWYEQAEYVNDPECVYLGILYFELGFEQESEADQILFFSRSKHWLETHLTATGEAWDAVDDRIADIDAFFKQKGREPIPVKTVEAAPAEPEMAAVVQESIEDHGTMMLVPAGSFLFGDEQRTVSVPAFYIDKHPVTNRQYEAFCRATGYRFPKHWNRENFKDPEAPVVGVSVNDALKYSRWVGKTLPSEEQWEKACRGVDGRRFPWGEDDASDARACFGRDPVEGGTAPVATHEEGESPYGVGDMAGNVWEWTATTDNDPEVVHIIKGGCYNDPPPFLEATVRLAAIPKDKFETIGFRCVKSA